MTKGLSALEIIIVLAVLGIIGAIGVRALPRFAETADLNAAAELGLSILEEARARTLGSEGAAQYGVHFEDDEIVLFQGAAFETMPGTHATSTFPRTVEISSIVLSGGGSDVIFERLTGETAQDGDIVFRLKRSPGKERILTVLQSGNATIIASSTPP